MMETCQADTAFFSLDCPLESMPGERQMRIANLGAFPALAREFGVDASSLLERHEINPQEIEFPDHLIDCRSFTELLEDCSKTFNAPLLGLKLAQLHEPDVYGCVTALCRSAPTVQDAIDSFIKYIRVTHSSASAQELVEAENIAELRWFVRSDLGCNQQANYHAALLMMKLLRQICGTQFRADYVALTVDSRNRDTEAAEKYFGCRFHQRAGVNAIAFRREFLRQSIPCASRTLFRLLGGYLDNVRASAETSLTDRIANYIVAALPLGQCSIEDCARKLGMAVRTLQTRLRESGFEFSGILEQQRMELANAYLKADQLSLYDISANLGYNDQSNFIRAFKRWTGTTPSQCRRQYRSERKTAN
jgi:AraC-like DNA-binding protein